MATLTWQIFRCQYSWLHLTDRKYSQTYEVESHKKGKRSSQTLEVKKNLIHEDKKQLCSRERKGSGNTCLQQWGMRERGRADLGTHSCSKATRVASDFKSSFWRNLWFISRMHVKGSMNPTRPVSPDGDQDRLQDQVYLCLYEAHKLSRRQYSSGYWIANHTQWNKYLYIC